MKTIALLGSTGSIGVSTLALVREFPERFRVHGMVAGQNLMLLAKQIKEFSPNCVAIRNEEDVPRLRRLLGNHKVEILWGESGASAVASAAEVDVDTLAARLEAEICDGGGVLMIPPMIGAWARKPE